MVKPAAHLNLIGLSPQNVRMKLLVALALCAVCVSGEETGLKRNKRGWGYEPPPQTTQKPGWGWTTQPPPPPPPPPTSGWGQPQPQPTQGWQMPPPQNGWGQSSYNNYYMNPSYGGGYSRYPRPWGQGRYGRYADYRDYSRYGRDYPRDRMDYYSSVRSPYSRRSSSLL